MYGHSKEKCNREAMNYERRKENAGNKAERKETESTVSDDKEEPKEGPWRTVQRTRRQFQKKAWNGTLQNPSRFAVLENEEVQVDSRTETRREETGSYFHDRKFIKRRDKGTKTSHHVEPLAEITNRVNIVPEPRIPQKSVEKITGERKVESVYRRPEVAKIRRECREGKHIENWELKQKQSTQMAVVETAGQYYGDDMMNVDRGKASNHGSQFGDAKDVIQDENSTIAAMEGYESEGTKSRNNQ